MDMTSWQTPVGTIGTRSDFQSLYGGSYQSGIESSRTTPNILVYTDAKSSKNNGYDFDGWDACGTVFLYTGEGRNGDQRLTRGNKSLFEQPESGKAIRLFEAVGQIGTGAKLHKYLGEFKVDPEAPYAVQTSVDEAGTKRQVYVFNLINVEPVEGSDQPHAPKVLDELAGGFEWVPLEESRVTNYEMPAIESSTAQKKEERLVSQFRDHLLEQGREVQRLKVYPPGSRRPLFTDICDVTERVLYEAKAGASRNYVREALGQILDYRRYLEKDLSCHVLLPQLPQPDLIALLHSYDIGLTYQDSEGAFVVFA